jgi:hypothetical protein
MLMRDYMGQILTCHKCGTVGKIAAQYTRNLEEYPPGPSYLLCKDCAIIKSKK